MTTRSLDDAGLRPAIATPVAALSVEEAIARVLAAEGEARAALAACAEQAEAEVQAARDRARAIAARGAARTAAVQSAVERALERLRRDHEVQRALLAGAGAGASAADDERRLARAAEGVADELTRGEVPAAGDRDRR
jgi:hypothetical protein